jgi:hypothetical protein
VEKKYMFSVDYATLHQIIQQFLYTGIFRAKVAASRSRPEEGHIELQVREGVIHTCCFISTRGQVYKWDKWETQLTQFGVLNWDLTPLESAGPLPRAPYSPLLVPSQQSPVATQKQSGARTPYHNHNHTGVLSPLQLHQLPMLYRKVYSLIDGRRQSADIAIVLHKSQYEITHIIDVLSQQGLIQLR